MTQTASVALLFLYRKRHVQWHKCIEKLDDMWLPGQEHFIYTAESHFVNVTITKKWILYTKNKITFTITDGYAAINQTNKLAKEQKVKMHFTSRECTPWSKIPFSLKLCSPLLYTTVSIKIILYTSQFMSCGRYVSMLVDGWWLY